jgi:BlaI family transcriptional regulator, penicillinase repressor
MYGMKKGSVADVQNAMDNAPGYSAVRTTLNILVRKGFLEHRKSGRKYLYSPTMPREKAGRLAIKSLLQTYFNNSLEDAVSGLINAEGRRLSERDNKQLMSLVRRAAAMTRAN